MIENMISIINLTNERPLFTTLVEDINKRNRESEVVTSNGNYNLI